MEPWFNQNLITYFFKLYKASSPSHFYWSPSGVKVRFIQMFKERKYLPNQISINHLILLFMKAAAIINIYFHKIIWDNRNVSQSRAKKEGGSQNTTGEWEEIQEHHLICSKVRKYLSPPFFLEGGGGESQKNLQPKGNNKNRAGSPADYQSDCLWQNNKGYAKALQKLNSLLPTWRVTGIPLLDLLTTCWIQAKPHWYCCGGLSWTWLGTTEVQEQMGVPCLGQQTTFTQISVKKPLMKEKTQNINVADAHSALHWHVRTLTWNWYTVFSFLLLKVLFHTPVLAPEILLSVFYILQDFRHPTFFISGNW